MLSCPPCPSRRHLRPVPCRSVLVRLTREEQLCEEGIVRHCFSHRCARHVGCTVRPFSDSPHGISPVKDSCPGHEYPPHWPVNCLPHRTDFQIRPQSAGSRIDNVERLRSPPHPAAVGQYLRCLRHEGDPPSILSLLVELRLFPADIARHPSCLAWPPGTEAYFAAIYHLLLQCPHRTPAGGRQCKDWLQYAAAHARSKSSRARLLHVQAGPQPHPPSLRSPPDVSAAIADNTSRSLLQHRRRWQSEYLPFAHPVQNAALSLRVYPMRSHRSPSRAETLSSPAVLPSKRHAEESSCPVIVF